MFRVHLRFWGGQSCFGTVFFNQPFHYGAPSPTISFDVTCSWVEEILTAAVCFDVTPCVRVATESLQWGPDSHERFPLRLLCSEWCAVIGSRFWDATAQWCVLNDCDTCQAVVVELQQVVVCCTAHWSRAIFRFVSLICSMTPKTKNLPLCGRSVRLSEGGSVTRLRLGVPWFESRFFFPQNTQVGSEAHPAYCAMVS